MTSANDDAPFDGVVHHELVEHFLQHGHAPRATFVAQKLGVREHDVVASFHRLADGHGLALFQGSSEVWLVHPFSSTPTLFWVSGAGGGGWWAPCIWCALGITALVGADATVSTRLGGSGELVTLEVSRGSVAPPELLAHFCIPVRQAWTDVHRFCSTALVFRSEACISAWCARHGMSRGSVLPVERVWELARAWYSGHRARGWRKHTRDEARAIFESVGLVDDFWSLESRPGLF